MGENQHNVLQRHHRCNIPLHLVAQRNIVHNSPLRPFNLHPDPHSSHRNIRCQYSQSDRSRHVGPRPSATGRAVVHNKILRAPR